MHRKKTLSTVAGLAVALSAPEAPAQADAGAGAGHAALGARVDAVIEQALGEERLVGAVVLVALDGRVVYRRAAGYADREARRPMTEGTAFRLASITKPVVSVATLALMDQGRLSLDDPVTRWLPGFRPRLPDGREPVVTVRHLLTHTAGLSYGFFEPARGPYARAGVSDGMDESALSLDENVRRIASVPLTYAPGGGWGYSVAHDVLGAVLARAAGAPLPHLVRTLVTDPLGMGSTGFEPRDASALATPYADGSPRPVRMTGVRVVPFGPGAGIRFDARRAAARDRFPSGGAGMSGTAGDVLRLLEAVRTGRAGLGPGTAGELMENAIGERRSMPGWGWGPLGAVLVDPAAAVTPQSPGTVAWGGAWGHSWFVDPARRLTVVALTNTAVEGMSGRFPGQLRDAVYEGLGR